MLINKNNTANPLKTVVWYDMDKSGLTLAYLLKDIQNKAGIYIFRNILRGNITYIGSSNNVKKRISSHFYSCNKKLKFCPKFYNSVNKYGWNNFKVGVIEYIEDNINENAVNNNKRKIILDREQFYFNMYNPTLNINKIAGSNLGFKHSKKSRPIIGIKCRSRSIDRLIQTIRCTPMFKEARK